MSGLWPTAALAYLTLALITDSCSGNGVRVLGGMLNVDRALFQPLLSASIVANFCHVAFHLQAKHTTRGNNNDYCGYIVLLIDRLCAILGASVPIKTFF